MKGNNLIIDLIPKLDKKEDVFHIGRIKFPGRITFDDGITFLIFLSESGEEEIQIATNNKENTKFSSYSKRPDKVEISLSSRPDSFGKTFYVAKVQFNGYVDCSDGVVFLVFSSKKGTEELQINGNVVAPFIQNRKIPDVIYNKRIVVDNDR